MSDHVPGVLPAAGQPENVLRTVAVTISRAARRLPGLDTETARRNAWEAVCVAEDRRRQRELTATLFADLGTADAPGEPRLPVVEPVVGVSAVRPQGPRRGRTDRAGGWPGRPPGSRL